MTNVHLNGDVVHCPNFAEIHRRANEIRDKHRICKYNYHESQCPAWMAEIRSAKYSGRCTLAGTDKCHGHLRRQADGNKSKIFKIDNQVYRKMASSAHYLVKTSENKVLFLTLTFPPFRRKTKLTKSIRENEIVNYYFSKFVENLRTNYNCGGYIAVREFGSINNRVHFHILLSIPFIPFNKLNYIWSNTIQNICFFARNAVTSNPKARFIKNPDFAIRYVCKYFSKSKGQESTARLVFFSNNLLSHSVPDKVTKDGEIKSWKRVSNIQKNITDPAQILLEGYKGIYIKQTSDYSTCFRITNSKDFNDFCEKTLYKLFDISEYSSSYFH